MTAEKKWHVFGNSEAILWSFNKNILSKRLFRSPITSHRGWADNSQQLQLGGVYTSLSSSAESNGSVIVTEILWKFPSTQRKGHRETDYLYWEVRYNILHFFRRIVVSTTYYQGWQSFFGNWVWATGVGNCYVTDCGSSMVFTFCCSLHIY